MTKNWLDRFFLDFLRLSYYYRDTLLSYPYIN